MLPNCWGLENDDEIDFRNLVNVDCTIDADPEQLFRVLLNLCRNAQQAMTNNTAGRTTNLLQVSAEQQELDVFIRVRDTGPGIAPHIRDNIFLPYNGTTKSDGSGLGMAIAMELVTAHNGLLSIEETSAEGTTFRIDLPDSACSVIAGEPEAQMLERNNGNQRS